jgi:hypothetical protein
MAAARSSRRRTTAEVLRSAARLTAAAALVAGLGGCSGDHDTAHAVADDPTTSPDASSVVSGADPKAPGSTESSGSTASTSSALLDYPPLFAALAVVPENADEVSFTDVAAVKERLGFGDLTSESTTADRFAFWERARADGAMFTGTRLDDASSLMSLDYGWTGEDVDWEIDFAATETGCLRSMICTTSHAYALGLRRDLDWSIVTKSLASNGFQPSSTDPRTLRTDDSGAPFQLVRLIPELHVVAVGNEIGLLRIGNVVDGAPSFGQRVGSFYDRLDAVESMHVTTGCVEIPDALGPESTTDDVTALLRQSPIAGLVPARLSAVVTADRGTAHVEVDAGGGATEHDLQTRLAIARSWPGLQTGVPFADVASMRGSVDSPYESFTLQVSRMRELRAMTLTGDAPWALCPYQGPR